MLREAEAAWREEGGRTWGRSLVGPLLLVEPGTRRVWASEADGEGLLAKDGDGVFSGVYPEGMIIANTTVTWAGKKWVMLLYPLPLDPTERRTLLLHESWHRLQRDLGLNMPEAFNAHLDSLDGRYWLQMEWRALAGALEAGDGDGRRVWIGDAIACRAYRQNLFPDAVEDERNMELHEGLAEYTGVSAAGARETLIRELKRTRPPYARSFAYLTGPAYGLLLDDAAPGWPLRVRRGTDLSVLLQEAYELPAPLDRDARRAASKLGGAELLRLEEAEERGRKRHIEEIWRTFVRGPTLKVPAGFRLQFNPSNTENIEGLGVYHLTATYMGDWGVLEATQGSLRSRDRSGARVPAPKDPNALSGPGWRLELAPGWTLVPCEPKGSFEIGRIAGDRE
jgi:hypothetical protein